MCDTRLPGSAGAVCVRGLKVSPKKDFDLLRKMKKSKPLFVNSFKSPNKFVGVLPFSDLDL